MTTIVKFLVALLVGALVTSCNFDFNISGVKGDGNVVTESRFSDVNFNKINASEGLDVYLTKSTSTAVKVQADENLQELIETEIKDGVLHIHTKETIGKYRAKKVLVNFTNLNEISSSSGAKIHTTNFILSDNIIVKASSGSHQKLAIKASTINCKSSSGANIELDGNTTSIDASASSGSVINAHSLIAESCTTKSSSGAHIDVNCKSAINAKASSGSNTSYAGNPSSVTKSKSSAASISQN
ncbi:MAG: DUF2807 domain-containing protein [Kordia sp.]|nr:MAG: DUF2807 domain-containing protein [Kordia sp.]